MFVLYFVQRLIAVIAVYALADVGAAAGSCLIFRVWLRC